MLFRVLQIIALCVMPFVLTGLVNRVKSLWSGRKGPPILQSAYDVLRLCSKSVVYSTATTPVFRIAPYLFLFTCVGSALVTPLFGSVPIVHFPFDYVWFAYVWALGRVAVMLAALDTGSSFEGMGAAREATFSTLLEPALFLIMGALCLSSRVNTLHEALTPELAGGSSSIVRLGAIVGLVIVLQVEAARMPVDDPATHLELTMVHEVMVLDHSGPDLGAIQMGSALKLLVGCSIVATLLNPWAGLPSVHGALVNLALSCLVAVAIGTIESLVARLKLRMVPHYIAIALASGAMALLGTGWSAGVSE